MLGSWFVKKILIIVLFGIFCATQAYSISSFKKYQGNGELKILKGDIFDILEFYFSAGGYGAIKNNPKKDWQKDLLKKRWEGMFLVLSQNGKGVWWYYNPYAENLDNSTNYLGKAKIVCEKQGHGECFVFAKKNRIIWQNGINPKKGTYIKRKDARKGLLMAKLKELGFYDDITSSTTTTTPKITKKKEETITVLEDAEDQQTKNKTDNDIVQKLKNLKELLDTDVITQDEFKKAKEKLLD